MTLVTGAIMSFESLLLVPLVFGLVRGRGRTDPAILDRPGDDDAGVRCPFCGWRPSRRDMWACNPGCGTAWNTFDTRGECPDCGKRWSQTQCVKCGTWSPHDDWYETPR